MKTYSIVETSTHYGLRMAATFAGWVGVMNMLIFSYTLDPVIGILGLIPLTLQACMSKLWNLVVLNIISIIILFTHLF